MHSISRLLDAVTNRCSEGFRVLEDIARFVFDNESIGSKLKEFRHSLRQKISSLDDSSKMISQRDIEADAGRFWKAKDEFTRATLLDVITANSKRIQEGLRTLEEIAKNSDSANNAQTAQFLESLRYEAYSIEKELITLIPLSKLKNLKFMLIFDPEQTLQEPFSTLEEVLKCGVDSVQFRVKNYADDERDAFQDAQKVKEICLKQNTAFFINDRADWALILEADGLHLGQKDLQVQDARKILHCEQLIGLSVSNEKELSEAQSARVDYLGVGAVFATQTKPECEISGTELYKKALEKVKIPVFSIGGIDENNVQILADIANSAKQTLRICVASAILKSKNPCLIAENIYEIISKT